MARTHKSRSTLTQHLRKTDIGPNISFYNAQAAQGNRRLSEAKYIINIFKTLLYFLCEWISIPSLT